MATMSAQGTQPVAGGDIEAAPITDTDNNIITTYNRPIVTGKRDV